MHTKNIKSKSSTISIKKNTKSILSSYGKFGQSFDDIIFELIQKLENRK